MGSCAGLFQDLLCGATGHSCLPSSHTQPHTARHAGASWSHKVHISSDLTLTPVLSLVSFGNISSVSNRLPFTDSLSLLNDCLKSGFTTAATITSLSRTVYIVHIHSAYNPVYILIQTIYIYIYAHMHTFLLFNLELMIRFITSLLFPICSDVCCYDG